MMFWVPNHYGHLEFQLEEAPAAWDQPYEPPREWQVQFFDSHEGGHDELCKTAT